MAKAIAHDQMVFSLSSLSQYIASGESTGSDAQFACLTTAYIQRLAARAQHREKQVTLPVYPGKPAAAPSAIPTQRPGYVANDIQVIKLDSFIRFRCMRLKPILLFL